MKKLTPGFFYFAATVAALTFGGCSAKSTSPPVPTSPPLTHMYLSLDVTAGSVQIYNTPVTAASVPTGTITPIADPAELFVDKTGRLFVPNGGGNSTVKVYTSPITGASTPAFTLTTLHTDPEDTTEDASGNVYVGVLNSNMCCIDIFPGPVNASASAGSEITANAVAPNGLGYPFGMGFDTSGNMYVSSTTSTIKYTPPISSASVPAANVLPNQDNYGLVLDASNNVYVANATTDGTIDVFTQPFQNGSARAFGLLVIPTATGYVEGMALDGSGNLWAVDDIGGVWEFTAPITSASVPTKILTVVNAYGIAFGP
ncbi:MAG TPA: hypothetical protein VGX02_00200 [Candidatus Eremiobacteraceae bacterium]|jgi:sugar lactone lactonase YvrE|nr:hypothetical protein [Candidatus Eremiobacteraceae bacterium]